MPPVPAQATGELTLVTGLAFLLLAALLLALLTTVVGIRLVSFICFVIQLLGSK